MESFCVWDALGFPQWGAGYSSLASQTLVIKGMPRAVLQRNLSAWEINIERAKVKQSFSLPGAHSRSLCGYHLLCLSEFQDQLCLLHVIQDSVSSFYPISLSSQLACPLLYCPGHPTTASVWALRPLCWLNLYEFRINKEFCLFGINEEFVQPIRDLFNKEFAHFFPWARFRTCNQSNKHAPLEIVEFWPGCRIFCLLQLDLNPFSCCMCAHPHMYACMWSPEDNIGHQSSGNNHKQSRLTAGVPPGTFTCLRLSSAWIANMHHHAQLFYMGSGDQTQVLMLERQTLL